MNLTEDLVKHFGIGSSELAHIIATAPARYKIYQIPKRRGGTRTIAQPSRELKAIQRYIVETTLSKFPVHPAATGYVKDRNILQNAEPHRRNRVILKLDFTAFFPSIQVKDWTSLVRTSEIGEPLRSDIGLYSKILFWGMGSTTPKCLSIGAPSSPALSNILMHNLDIQFSSIAVDSRVIYTRYADDITVSGDRIEHVTAFETAVQRVVKSIRSPKLTFNNEKRGIYLRGQRRMVTGLVITPTQNVSIGRARKRLISVMLHHVLCNKSNPASMAHLKGMIGFCLANEPSFIDRMRAKYGSEILDRVLKYRIPSAREMVT